MDEDEDETPAEAEAKKKKKEAKLKRKEEKMLKKEKKEKGTRVVEKSVLRMFWLDAVENQGAGGAGSISGASWCNFIVITPPLSVYIIPTSTNILCPQPQYKRVPHPTYPQRTCIAYPKRILHLS